MEKLIVSPSPHIHSGDSISKNMYAVLIALIPAIMVSVLQFGLGAIITLLVATVSCVVVEHLISRFLLKEPSHIMDGSAALTGVLLGMNLPSNIAPWIVVLGAIVAIGVAKMSFGGLGGNIFNPALVGRVFLLLAYPAQMASWPVAGKFMNYVDAETGATPLGIMKGVIHNTPGVSVDNYPGFGDLFLGANIGGSLGEVSALALLVGLAYLLYRKVITWHIPVSILVTAFVFGQLMHWVNPAIYPTGTFQLLSGGMLLGAIFMATDYVTSPMSKSGQLLYGALIGLITILIRLFGSYPEGMSFAILIMNGATPLINMYLKPKHFGGR